MKNEIIAGLDIGSSKVTCLIAKVNSDKVGTDRSDRMPEIIGTGIARSQGIAHGFVVNLEHAANSIKTAVQEAEKRSNVKLSEVYLSIAASHIRGESARGVVSISRQDKEVTHDDVAQVIQQAVAIKVPLDRQIIHTLPQEFILDDLPRIQNPVGMSANRLEGNIYIITGSATAIQNICKAVHHAGIKPREIVLQSIASAYAVLSRDEQELGCMLIDIGEGTTDTAVFYNGAIHDTITLPLGGADITNDISIGLLISRAQAEEIKINYGVARSELASSDTFKIHGNNGDRTIEKTTLAQILAPRIEEIFGILHRSLKYAEYLDLLPSGVVLTGGTAKTQGITGLAERVFRIPAKIGSPNTVEGIEPELRDPAFASAIGLIIYGASNDKHTLKQVQGMGKPTRSSASALGRFSNRMKRWLLE